MGFIAKLKGFDAHAKPQAHLTKKTAEGGLVSLVGFALMAVLFLSELFAYMVPKRVTTMGVDVTRDELLRISVDITYPGLPCQLLSLDALDVSGKHEADIGGELHKERVAPDETSLGVYESHFEDPMLGFIEFFRPQKAGTPSPRLLHVEEIHAALKAKEGCRVHGNLKVQRVAGNFHVSVHGQDWETLRLVYDKAEHINVSHVIKRLSFGDDYPGKVDPLNGFVRIIDAKEKSGTYKYFMQIVPTRYTRRRLPGGAGIGAGAGAGAGAGSGGGGAGGSRGTRGKPKKTPRGVIDTNLYSVTEFFQPARGWTDGGIPATYFLYDLSPIVMEVSDAPSSLGHFLARVCAVVGGGFAVTGMMDRWIHRVVELVGKNA